tara:strand:- start:4049 stop:4525 length:477 start_codon:yes stop_codon:yes gene_type:complete
MISDFGRAVMALLLASACAAGLTAFAPELREAGLLPAPAQPEPELVYSIVNITEDFQARTACPLDLAAARARIEAGLRAQALKPVFSPIAEGPGVFTQEVIARPIAGNGTMVCGWAAHATFNGQRGPLRHDREGHSYSGLEAASLDARPLLAQPVQAR